MNIQTACKSEKGRRSQNEDACLILTSDDLNGAVETLMVVADGMGGRASGAVASSMAVSAVRESCELQMRAGVQDIGSILSKAIQQANDSVFGEASRKAELLGMGTTCVVLAVKADKVYYSYLGDSRAYLLRDGDVRRLTDDHSFVAEKVKSGDITEEQARTSRFRNVITKAVGLTANSEPDSGTVDLKYGDAILLCTDGLTTAVRDGEIADVLCTSSNPKEACDRLVDVALKNGSRDNVTVVVSSLGVSSARRHVDKPVERRRRGAWLVPALLSLLLGIGVGLYPARTLVTRLIKPVVNQPAHITQLPDLTHLKYGDPELLVSHIPLLGKYIAADQQGNVFVVTDKGKVIRVSFAGQIDDKYLSRDTFKSIETRSPMMASDALGDLYISDPKGKKILKFDSTGKFISNIGLGKLSGPEALTIDNKGTIFVVDAGRLMAIRPVTPDNAQMPGGHE